MQVELQNVICWCSRTRRRLSRAMIVTSLLLIVRTASGQRLPALTPVPVPGSLAALEFKIDYTPPFAALPNGTLAFYDLDENQIVYVNGATGAETRFGRTGDGPGEFRAVTEIAPASDGRLVALSPTRITIIGSDQKAFNTVRLARPFAGLLRPSKDSAFLVGTGYDTVFSISLRTGETRARFGQRREDSLHFRGKQPYERGFWLVPRGEKDWFVASGYKYYVGLEDANGAHRGTIDRAVEPEMPSKSELDDSRRQLQRGNPKASLDGMMKRMASTPKAFITSSPVQDAKGRLWVPTGRMRSDSTEVDIFSAGGKFLGSVRMPGVVRRMATDKDQLYVITKYIDGRTAGDFGVLRYRVN